MTRSCTTNETADQPTNRPTDRPTARHTRVQLMPAGRPSTLPSVEILVEDYHRIVEQRNKQDIPGIIDIVRFIVCVRGDRKRENR